MIMPAKEVLEKIQQKKTEYKNMIKELGQDLFIGLAKPLFDAFPSIEAVRWSQWIPGFNDGEACTFTLGDAQVRLANVEDGGDDDDGWHSSWDLTWDSTTSKHDETKNKAEADALDAFNDTLDEDICEQVFGANTQITITRTGLETEDYDCGY